jgi:hypothetical protein
MRTAFSRALYYPSIDIYSTEWLKTALLFWDEINTIVPESIKYPYISYDTQYLEDVGFLKPYRINSVCRSVIGIEEEFIDFIELSHFRNLNIKTEDQKLAAIWNKKISRSERYKILREFSETLNSRDEISDYMSYCAVLNGEQIPMSDGVLNRMRFSERLNNYLCLNGFYRNGEMWYTGPNFVHVYMTVLANKICEDESIALITDDISSYGLAENIRSEGRYHVGSQITQGILLELIIKGLHISPNTDFETIIKFKNRYDQNGELGHFRTELAKLAQSVTSNNGIDALRQEVKDVYVNEFIPAYNELKAALKGFKINWLTDNCMKISAAYNFASSSSALKNLLKPQALLTGGGASLVASLVKYNEKKKEKLRISPYSYLLATEKEF